MERVRGSLTTLHTVRSCVCPISQHVLWYTFGYLHSVDWSAGLECWTGVLDWSAGLECWTGVLDWSAGLEYWKELLEWSTREK